MQLNYGGSDGRFSWILYKLENLKCWGKADGVIYPSEHYQTKLETIETDIQENSDEITELTQETQNDIQENSNQISNLFELANQAETEIAILQDQTAENENDIHANTGEITILQDETTKNKNNIESNDNDISGLKSRTTELEGKVITNDYYFKYQAYK